MIQKNVVAKIEKATKNQKTDSNQTTISEMQQDVVVPSNAFDFQAVVFTPQPKFEFNFEEKLVQTLTKPIYRLSFFEKLFTHHIATNAP